MAGVESGEGGGAGGGEEGDRLGPHEPAGKWNSERGEVKPWNLMHAARRDEIAVVAVPSEIERPVIDTSIFPFALSPLLEVHK